MNSSVFLLNSGVLLINLYAGNSATKAAEKSKSSLIENAVEYMQPDKRLLTIMQIESRDLNIQNDFFIFNWRMLTRVSYYS